MSNFLFALLLALACSLAVVVVVLSLMLAQRHKADVKRLERYVYVRESFAKTADCVVTPKNKDKKRQAESVEKKPRHGKKNKQNKSSKEANE